MEGWNGGRESFWSYRQGSDVSSSRSGTIISSAYTSRASSRASTSTLSIGALHFDSLGIHEERDGNNVDDHDGESRPWGWWGKAADDCKVRIRSLVQEFSIAPSANYSVKIGGMSVVERWLTELGVGWVLSLDDFASAGEELDRDLRRWIRALDEIAQTMCFMGPLLPDIGDFGEEEREQVGETCSPARHHLVMFIREAMLKMATFVDVIVALDTFYSYMTEGLLDPAMAPLYNKLIALLDVHDALSEASNKIVSQFGRPTSVEAQRIENEMTILLSANKSKVDEVIWSIMENIRTKSIGDGDDLLSSLDPQGSSNINKATRSVVMYINFLRSNDRLVDAVLRAKYIHDIVHVRPLDSMISEMVSCLEEKLANISESFPNQGLSFLFLLNNSYYILQQAYYPYLYCVKFEGHKCRYLELTYEIEGYIKRYVEVSWALLLLCLLNPMPLCLGRNYSPLSKFESGFHKIYTTQKQWKVPDPVLRRRLRKAIGNKIIPAYTKYLEDNKVTTPKIHSPRAAKDAARAV